MGFCLKSHFTPLAQTHPAEQLNPETSLEYLCFESSPKNLIAFSEIISLKIY